VVAFNTEKFDQSQFQERTTEVPVPELSEFFDKEDKLIWTVRGLTGHELAKVNEAIRLNKDIDSILSGITSETQSEKIEAVKESLGLTDNTPGDLVRRIAALKNASVDPVTSQEMAVKLADTFPTIFYLLTNKIFELTGEGKMLGELKASGETVT
jgi:hypothetical protein